MKNRLLEYFGEFVTESRKTLIEQILNRRTRMLTVVLENIYQSQNASAVIRTCDCFGIQDLHVIEHDNRFKVNPHVVRGASKWVTIHEYKNSADNTAECIESLRVKGYAIVATTPSPDALPVYEYEVDKPVALLFGTEDTGLTERAFSMADARVTIPMYGFTESLNISVSASLTLSILRDKLNESDLDWRLTSNEKDELRLKWYKHSVSQSDILERQFMKSLRE